METFKRRNEIIVQKINALFKLIGYPSDNTWEKNAILSDCINALIRSEYIYLRRDYVCEFYGSEATINPYLFPEKVRTNIQSGEEYLYEKIFANSFGPFNPEEYFKIDRKFRIVWLLKEPYILPGSWYNGDRGGHDQAQGYYKEGWDVIRQSPDNGGNPTIANLLRYSKKLLEGLIEGLKEKFLSIDENVAMKEVMNHICILEVNHFPGLAFNGTNSEKNLNNWGSYNKELLKVLINFYKPNIIFYPKEDPAKICLPNNLIKVAYKDNGEKECAEEGESTRFVIDDFCHLPNVPKPSILDRDLKRSWFKKDIISTKEKRYKATILQDGSSCLWICFLHPSFNWPKLDNVISWICRIFEECQQKQISKENGSIKSPTV